MREILFRGLHPDENGPQEITLAGKKIRGRWVEGDFGRPCNIIFEEIGYDPDLDQENVPIYNDYNVIPETVGQYININDRSGQKIFEGDVVSFSRINAIGYYTKRIGYVRYYEKLPIFYIMATTGDAWDWCDCEEIKVIGNIFSNTELIEGEVQDDER